MKIDDIFIYILCSITGHYVYIKNATKRFSLSDAATAAGYSIKNVEISNLIPGLAYNKNSDSIEGYVSASIQMVFTTRVIK